jgi:predicted nucleic-acid-binding protein
VLVDDDPRQSPLARAALANAELIAIPTAVLCELAWVLRRGYGLGVGEIADAIRRIVGGATVAADRASIDAGLVFLEQGGDFADGVIAYEGAWLGGEVFLSFDEEAVSLAQRQGLAAELPV